ncbi:MAG: hypothetical protein EX272_06235 [Chromatiales bacterium]|nr:MAG: hypothetical protein EX272_06235 [Chromatiales bacterium]
MGADRVWSGQTLRLRITVVCHGCRTLRTAYLELP